MYRKVKILCQAVLVLLMGFEVAVGTINIGTGVAGTQYSVTGVTPATGTWKALKLTWSGRSETTDASGEQDIQPGIGFAVSSTSRRAVTGQSDHGPTTTANDSYHTDVAVVAVLDITGAAVGLADFVSFNADGFTLVVDDAFPAALEVSYTLLGGTDLTNAEIGQFQLAVGTGNNNYTGLTTFQPDFALFTSISSGTAPPSGRVWNLLSVGAATATSQAVLSVKSRDNQGTSVTSSYCRAGEIFAAQQIVTALAVDGRASLTSFLSDGFQINTLEDGGQFYIFFLALKGGSYAVGDFLTATDLNNFTEAVGFTPKGAMFFSANRAEDTQDAATNHLEWSVGAATSSTSRTAQYVRDKDGSANADCFSAVEHDNFYINGSNDATQVIEGLCDMVTMADPMTMAMSDADPVASFTWYVAFGNAAGLTTLTLDDTALMVDEFLKQQTARHGDDGQMADEPTKTLHKLIDDLPCRTV